jgi:predicted Holliday junction resolvase-like endonuclease
MASIQEELSATPLNKPLMSAIEQYLAQETKDLRREVEKERRQNTALLQEKEEALRKQEEAQRKQEEAQRKQEEAQRKQEEAQRNSVRMALNFGATKQQIAKELNLPLKEVERIVYELGL